MALALLFAWITGVNAQVTMIENDFNDSSGTYSSFTAGTNWSDGLAPHADATYTNTGRALFTPFDGNNYTFGGESLTLTGNGVLAYKGSNDSTITINNLTVLNGIINGSGQYTLAGNITLESGEVEFEIYTESGIEVISTISGPGALTVKSGDTDDTRDAGAITLSSGNTYSGGTTVNERENLIVANTSGSATGTEKVDILSNGLIGGGSGSSNGGILAKLGTVSRVGALGTYPAGVQGIIGGNLIIEGGGYLAPGSVAGNVATLTTASLTLTAGAIVNYQFNKTANSFTAITAPGGLTLSGGGFNLYKERTTTPFTTPGIYNIFSYQGTLNGNISSLSVLNAQPGYNYTFSNDTDDGLIQLEISSAP